MGKRYYCNYCDKTMAATPQILKTHNKGLVHQKLVLEHYQRFKDPETILQEESTKKPCSRFPRGECQFGSICRFSHYTREQIDELRELVAAKAREKIEAKQPSFIDLYQKLQNEKSLPHETKNSVLCDQNGITHIFPWTYNPTFEQFAENLPPSLKKFEIRDFENVDFTIWGEINDSEDRRNSREDINEEDASIPTWHQSDDVSGDLSNERENSDFKPVKIIVEPSESVKNLYNPLKYLLSHYEDDMQEVDVTTPKEIDEANRKHIAIKVYDDLDSIDNINDENEECSDCLAALRGPVAKNEENLRSKTQSPSVKEAIREKRKLQAEALARDRFVIKKKKVMAYLETHLLTTKYIWYELKRIGKYHVVRDELRKMVWLMETPFHIKHNTSQHVLKCYRHEINKLSYPIDIWAHPTNHLVQHFLKLPHEGDLFE